MKIVIDIPEYLYDHLHDIVYDDYTLDDYELAIFNGTPLSKEQYKIMQQIESYHAKAKELKYIKKPLAWALYQVWKEVDKEESEEDSTTDSSTTNIGSSTDDMCKQREEDEDERD